MLLYTVDEYGTRTEYVYDSLDRQIETRYQAWDDTVEPHGALRWVVTRTVYDHLGRAVVASDPYVVADPTDPMPASLGTFTTYDSLGRAVKTERVEGLTIEFQGSGDPQYTHRDEPRVSGATVVWSTETIYDAQGRQEATVGRHAPRTAAESDTAYAQRLATVTTNYEYDDQGRQTAVIGPVVADELTGQFVRLRTETEYDDGRVQCTTTNIRVVTNALGVVQSISDADAQMTSYVYDAYGRTVRTIYADESFTATKYDALGRRIGESQQLQQGTAIEWSDAAKSFIVPESNPVVLFPTRWFEYDTATGRLTAVVLPQVLDPDNSNQAARPRYEYAYDAYGNQTLIRDPMGRETRFTYGDQGNETSRTLPLGFGPDGIRGTTDDSSLSEGSFKEEKFYDDRGRLDYEVSFEGIVTQYVYDDSAGAGSRLAEKLFFADTTAYDAWVANSAANPPQEKQVFCYDALGRTVRTEHHRQGGRIDVFETQYDADGRVLRESSPTGQAGVYNGVNYEYDPVTGLRIRLFTGTSGIYAGDQSDPLNDVRYTYDSLGRLWQVLTVERNNEPVDSNAVLEGDQPEKTEYRYDLMGNLDRTDLPGGVVTDYSYDELNRLHTLTQYGPDSTPSDLSDNPKIAEFVYTVRADGKRTAATETYYLDPENDGATSPHVVDYVWDYDNLGRLLSETIDHFDDTLDRTESFVYDLVSNRKEREIDRSVGVDELFTYGYDANDRLLEELVDHDGTPGTDRTVTYGYHRTQQTSKTVVDGATITSQVTNTYDLQGRLSRVLTEQYSGGAVTSRTRVSYEYDPQGIRVASLEEIDGEANGEYETRWETRYLVDPHNPTGYTQTIEETEVDADSGQVHSKRVYVFGHDEITQTVYEYAGGAVQSETTHVFAHDGHGSVRVLLDAAAAIAQVYTYSAYGELLAIHNAAAAQVGADASAALTSLLYSGEHFDPKIGQQYLRARWYDPSTGRLNPLDPAFGDSADPLSLHKYLYCHANPVNGIDPTGQFFSIMLGAALDANLQTMAAHGYEAAYEFSKGVLGVYESYFNMMVTRALCLMPAVASNIAYSMAMLSVIAAIRDEGSTKVRKVDVSRVMNMSPGDWTKYIQDTYGHLPQAHQVGHATEDLMKAWLINEKGYTDVIAMQNLSNQGVDIVARHKSGRWAVFEVKGHISGGRPNVRGGAAKGAKEFAEDVLGRIKRGVHGWPNVSADIGRAVDALEEYIRQGKTIHGVVLNVEHVLDATRVMLTTKVWKKFLRR